jgi:hypothetical protein
MDPTLWLEEKIKIWFGNWTVYTTLGSFGLYLIGYLALRFHLTALGVGTDLAVLDERYLFAGAKFLVYLVSSVPNVVLLCLIICLIFYAPYVMLPRIFKQKVSRSIAWSYQQAVNWWAFPTRLALAGVAFAVIVIQVVMRQCYFYNNLLLAPRLSGPVWLQKILLGDEALKNLYFAGLLALMGLAITALSILHRHPLHTGPSRVLTRLLAFLVAVQTLLLPINYGYFIEDKMMPRVSSLAGQPLQPTEEAWLIWEGKQGITYFVVRKISEPSSSSPGNTGQAGERSYQRSLLTFPTSESRIIEIICYDAILHVIFRGESKCTGKLPAI